MIRIFRRKFQKKTKSVEIYYSFSELIMLRFERKTFIIISSEYKFYLIIKKKKKITIINSKNSIKYIRNIEIFSSQLAKFINIKIEIYTC